MNAKGKAILAHITIIGWIIALILNQNDDREEFASFYLRQVLGISLLGLLLSFIPGLNLIAGILVLALWIISLVKALSAEKYEIPVLGEYFQDWFKMI
ncbi:MAG: YtxH domain-containing protein [Bacteroidetes bacterium]|jgi:uncharacterized membrane protein|nr:YtxH domain-containing protein [Bacteroidota bacterium]